jgi:hypothetical protein
MYILICIKKKLSKNYHLDIIMDFRKYDPF